MQWNPPSCLQALQSLRIIFTGVDVNPRVKPCPDCCSCIASVHHLPSCQLQCNKMHNNPKCSVTNKCTVTTKLRQLVNFKNLQMWQRWCRLGFASEWPAGCNYNAKMQWPLTTTQMVQGKLSTNNGEYSPMQTSKCKPSECSKMYTACNAHGIQRRMQIAHCQPSECNKMPHAAASVGPILGSGLLTERIKDDCP